MVEAAWERHFIKGDIARKKKNYHARAILYIVSRIQPVEKANIGRWRCKGGCVGLGFSELKPVMRLFLAPIGEVRYIYLSINSMRRDWDWLIRCRGMFYFPVEPRFD